MTIPPPQPPPPPAHPRVAWHHEDQTTRGATAVTLIGETRRCTPAHVRVCAGCDGDTAMMDQSAASSGGHPMETEGEMAAAPPTAAAEEEEDLPIMKHRQMIVDHIEHNPVTCIQVRWLGDWVRSSDRSRWVDVCVCVCG